MRFPESNGNKVFLACTCGLDPFELGRRKKDEYQAARMMTLLDGWFGAHEKCSGGPDKWRLAYAASPNYDVPLDAEPVDNAVRLALVKSIG